MNRPWWASSYNVREFLKLCLIIGGVILVGLIVSIWLAP